MTFVHPSGDLTVVSDFISPVEEEAILRSLYDEATVPPKRWVGLSRRRLLNLGGLPGVSNSYGEPTPMIPEPLPSWVTDATVPRLHEVNALLLPTTLGGEEGAVSSEVELPAHSASKAAAAIRAATPAGSSGPQCVCAYPVNHVLVNEYVAPNGILPHEDGPIYEPIVTIVSLESAVQIAFTRKKTSDGGGRADALTESAAAVVLCLPPRSLLVFTGIFYSEYLHFIPEGSSDTYTRDTCGNFEVAAALPGCVVLAPGQVEVPRGPRRISLTYRRVRRVAALSRSALFGGRRR